jgi:hypothetical protein
MIRTAFLLVIVMSLITACDGGGPAASVGLPPEGSVGDSIPTPPADSIPQDSVPPPPPPPDSAGPPSDSVPYTPVHVGIPFGPTQMEMESFGPEYSGTIFSAQPEWIMAALERARRTNTRLLVNFTNNESSIRDENGFSFEKWKQKVDLYRGFDFSSYIADGTLLAHYIMDEPYDPTNWNGKPVTAAEVEELAKYSKEIWPNLPTIVGVWPGYLKGVPHVYLDGVRHHFHIRYAPIEEYEATNLRDAKAEGLSYITGLNLLNGGTGESGIPGRKEGKFAMSAREITAWGNLLIADPYVCGFVMFEYDVDYLARPDIKDALTELKKKAEAHPQQSCRAR